MRSENPRMTPLSRHTRVSYGIVPSRAAAGMDAVKRPNAIRQPALIVGFRAMLLSMGPFLGMLPPLLFQWSSGCFGSARMAATFNGPAALFRLEPRGLHHFGKALRLAVQRRAIFVGADADRLDARGRELGDHLGLLDDHGDFARDPLDDRSWRADAGHHALDHREIEARRQFGDRRRVRRM